MSLHGENKAQLCQRNLDTSEMTREEAKQSRRRSSTNSSSITHQSNKESKLCTRVPAVFFIRCTKSSSNNNQRIELSQTVRSIPLSNNELATN